MMSFPLAGFSRKCLRRGASADLTRGALAGPPMGSP
jgi:hypothetical protein